METKGMPTSIVTGGNRGIGKETARGLARAGHRIVLACRNMADAEKARAEIVAETGNSAVSVIGLDLASRASIEGFVAAFKRDFGSLDVLVNNAGISTNRRGTTEEGFELNIGTNYVGTYLLTMGLLPLLGKGRGGRIVNLSSNIQSIGWFQTSKIGKYRWVRAYAVSKRMLLYFTSWLAEALRERGVSVNAVHPGIVRTAIMFNGDRLDGLIRAMLAPFFIEAAEGAKVSIALATGELAGTGKFYLKGRPKAIRMTAGRRREMADLMEFSEGLKVGEA